MSNLANPYGNQLGGGTPSAPQPAKSNTMKIVLIIVGVILFVLVLVCAGLAALLLPAISAAREAARLVSDSNSMRMIGLAMHNYHDAYKSLPAPAATNAENKPVWSWAVSITPFVEKTTLFQKLDFKDMQPWDDPKNSALQEAAPACFQSIRANLPPGSNEGNVFVISGPTTDGVGPGFIDGKFLGFQNIRDGLSNTILAIQLVKHSKPWASPSTLTMDEAFDLIKQEDGYFLVLMFDGAVKPVPTTIDRATFDAMVTRNGDERVEIPEYR